MRIENEPWWDDARCQNLDEKQKENFFSDNKAKQNAAIRICNKCPVERDCLFYALKIREDYYGVWGGTTPQERKRMQRFLASSPDRPHYPPASSAAN